MKNHVFILLTSLFVGVCNVCGQVMQLNDAPLYEIGGQSTKGISRIIGKYTQYIKTWYKNLPYASMKNPEYYGLKTITFIGVFMLIPQNT